MMDFAKDVVKQESDGGDDEVTGCGAKKLNNPLGSFVIYASLKVGM